MKYNMKSDEMIKTLEGWAQDMPINLNLATKSEFEIAAREIIQEITEVLSYHEQNKKKREKPNETT